MPNGELNTPVAFLIFNRPDTTERVFTQIARARPPMLLVVADGPRADRPGEALACRQTRKIIESVDWPCEVITEYSELNMGCRRRVSSGLDWIFSRTDKAIILEDDCLPVPEFFPFCEEMLDRYQDDERIGLVSGDNFQFGKRVGSASYYFSRYAHIWGWATWRRAWKKYDVDAALWPRFRDEGHLDRLLDRGERAAWRRNLEGVYAGRIDTWDYQWTLACWANSMLAILPQENLISNIGFGANATHTTQRSRYANMKTGTLEWPLTHPEIVAPDAKADARTAAGMFSVSLARRALARLVGN